MTTETANLPPATNRGAETREGEQEGEIGVDWVEFSIEARYREAAQFETDGGEWLALDYGGLGYSESALSASGVRAFWDDRREEAHFQLKGEVVHGVETWKVLDLLRWVKERGGTFSRIDVQVTVDAALCTVARFVAALESEQVVTHARAGVGMRGLVLGGRRGAGALSGDSVYVGAAKSRRRLRMYDKGAEQGGPANERVRFELQERDEAADECVAQLLQHGDVGRVFSERVTSFVDFRAGAEAELEKRPRAAWWVALVGAFGSARAYPPKKPRTVEQVAAWVARQVGPSLAVLAKVGRMRPMDVAWLIAEGERRWGEKHRSMVTLELGGAW